MSNIVSFDGGENMMRSSPRLALTWVAVLVIGLVGAAPALADGEPPAPLSASTTDVIVAGIVIAAVVVLAWLALYRLAEARRAARRRRTGEGEKP